MAQDSQDDGTLNLVYKTLTEAPSYHLMLEGMLFLSVLYLIFRKKKHPDPKIKLTLEEEEQVLQAWKPKPLVDGEKLKNAEANEAERIWGPIEGRPGKFFQIGEHKYLNLATHNYLGLVDDPALDDEAERCIRKYGVGSCGPRGFYGTVDVHIKLEEKIAEFLKLEETALYSYGFSTIASAIPSYSKAGDIIFADEQVNFSIQKGLQASRSIVHYFKHNDADDLNRLLDEQQKLDRRNPTKARTVRRFCIVEGIYYKTGEMCPLNEVAKLCRKHKVRLFIDESISFATIGATGRGVTEYLNVPLEDIDLISGSLENGLAAFGGFIVGPSFVVDHQRISGLGYCFSASLPPLLAGVGIQSLKILEKNPHYVGELNSNCKFMHTQLQSLSKFTLCGHELAPIKHLHIKDSDESRKSQTKLLDQIITTMKDEYHVALMQPSYLENEEAALPPPSIRLSISRLLTIAEMASVVEALETVSQNIIK